MTPSDKPGSSDSSPQQQEADQTSVMTELTGESTDNHSTESPTDAGKAEAESHEAKAAAPDGDGTATQQAEVPPPWQRTSAATSSKPAPPPIATEDTQTFPKQGFDAETVRTKVPDQSTGPNRSAVNFGAAARPGNQGSGNAARRPSRGPRRASLQVKRLDPWSVLKLALVLSVALFFVWMIAVAVLYGVLDGMGVWDQLNGTFNDLTQPEDAASEPLISAGRVFGIASIIGAINIVLFTALATVAAFIYNVAADFAGGVEVTLSERE